MLFNHQASAATGALPTTQKLYLFLLILFAFIVQLFDPIRMGDTDMWYHLSDGRYFWTTGQVADSYFYSFYPQTETWFNHFWGFQALIYKIYEYSGYQGLVITRSVLFLLIVTGVAYFIFSDQPKKHFYLKVILFLLLAFLIQGRAYQLRPHLFSYMMIPIFLVLLEKRRDLILLLPVFAAIWISTHAIEWVIAALICGAYFLEELFTKEKQSDKRFLTVILLTPIVFLLSPDTLALIKAPFSIPAGFSNYIAELQPVNPVVFYSVTLSLKSLDANTAFTLLAGCSVTGIIFLGVKKKLRLSHLILALASFYLLTKGSRFIWEWALLNLPLLTHAINNLPPTKPENLAKKSHLVLYALAFYPFYLFYQTVNFHQPYPLNPEGLPEGSVAFLKQTNAQGNLFLPPNEAGYTQEELHPAIKIHSDMKSNATMFLELGGALANKEAFKNLTEKYRIDFALLTNPYLKKNDILKELGYVPVFLDTVGVLYAHPELQKAITDNYQITTDLFSSVEDAAKADYLREMERVLEIYPSERVLLALIIKRFHEKEYDKALEHAQLLYELFPYSANSAYWIGNLYENKNMYHEALKYYRIALEYSDENFKQKVLRQVGTCYYLLEDFGNAYDAFSQSMNIFKYNETVEDMFQYAFSAIIKGKLDQAKMILSSIIQRAPEDKAKIKQSAKNLLDDINAGKYDAPGFFNWLYNTALGNT